MNFKCCVYFSLFWSRQVEELNSICRINIIRHSSSSSSSSSGGSSNATSSPTYHTATQPEPLADYSQQPSDTESRLPPIARIPLSEEVSWIPKPVYSTASESDGVTRVTTLDNGIRVASEPKFGSFCTVGG